ncbi:glycosyltransferase family 32 protein [Mucilaginibacter sp. P25]|uniref:glycosyltransferase family 32 protein n=1 Tax=Mucilaginibacter sp. P25 TaxID=3423945 RepID=UPI003D7A0A80
MHKIPQIIHQTWKTSDIPASLQSLSQSWKSKHPNWEYKLWTDEMNRNFIVENFPEFLAIYGSYEYNIERVDSVRYFILYHYGGLLVDLDFECLKDVTPLLEDATCIFGVETEAHCPIHNRTMIICNAFMACSAKNNFMKQFCDELKKDVQPSSQNCPSWQKVLETAGPFKLTDIYDNFHDKTYLSHCKLKPVKHMRYTILWDPMQLN